MKIKLPRGDDTRLGPQVSSLWKLYEATKEKVPPLPKLAELYTTDNPELLITFRGNKC
jgi:hypothetical protein